VAQSLLNRAVKAEDGNPEIYKEQGALFEAQGSRAEAVVAYKKYLDLSPNAIDRALIDARIRNLGGN
jgi:Flp pilus assembly protein TadD